MKLESFVPNFCSHMHKGQFFVKNVSYSAVLPHRTSSGLNLDTAAMLQLPDCMIMSVSCQSLASVVQSKLAQTS